MQTFLPYPDFTECARALDYKRLGKQRVEAKQILKALHYRELLASGWTPPISPKTGKPKRIGWINHSATLMWEGYELALCEYMNVMIGEWVGRGYKNTMPYIVLAGLDVVCPHWLGDENLHRSHRSNLLSKAPEFYNQYDWNVPDNLPYVWHTGLQHASDLRSEKPVL